MATTAENNIFSGTLGVNPVTQFTLFRGVTDYTNLAQFDLFETGYSFLVLLQMPVFMDKLGTISNENGGYKSLIDNYRHVIEYEFRGIQGIEDITSDTAQLQNGITDLSIITRVVEQGGSQFTMQYFERSGSLITKVHELFLRGVKDPKTQVKRYNGLLKDPITVRSNNISRDNASPMTDKGYQYEIYHFLYIVTDNTALNVEKAYILASCQPAAAPTGTLYNSTRGEIQFPELSLTFNGLPIPGRLVTSKARDFLKYINNHTVFDEMEFGCKVLSDDEMGGSGYAATEIVEAKNAGGANISSPKWTDQGFSSGDN